MNNKRRKQLKDMITKIEILKDELDTISSDEQDYLDNMPENLQGSINGINSEEAIERMADATDIFDEVIEVIEEIIY